MGTETPGQTPEGRLIEEAAKASGRSIRSLAANAGISDTRWRHLTRGWQPGHEGVAVPARAQAETLARIALVLEITPDQLLEAGRGDAAKVLIALQRASPGDTVSFGSDRGIDSYFVRADGSVVVTQVKGYRGPDEIDLIYASTTMSAKEKLYRIRQVLQLRAQADAEEQELRQADTEEAPAGMAEASEENLPESQQS